MINNNDDIYDDYEEDIDYYYYGDNDDIYNKTYSIINNIDDINNISNNETNISWNINEPIINFPNSLKCLSFGNKFNQNIDNLPDSLIYLSLGNKFNQKVDDLPHSLKILKFGNNFNQKINNLPNTLIYLSFGNPQDAPKYFIKSDPEPSCDFNNSLTKLPRSLISLHFNFCSVFNYSDILFLPTDNLKYLTISGFYKGSLNYLPDSIQYLTIFSLWGKQSDGFWKPRCKKFLKLPKNIKKVICFTGEFEEIDITNCNNINVFFDNIR